MKDEPPSSSYEIAVSIHDAAWLDAIADLEEWSQGVVSHALGHLGIGQFDGRRGAVEVSLVFTDDAEQRGLNRDYRQKDSPTNVLSFPNMDEDESLRPADSPRLLGDVVLARETVEREAAAQGKTPADHTAHLLVHGLLHLLGYDHQDSPEAEEMEALETGILAALGIADPYAAEAPAAAGGAHG
jgi:probable rRNA maturation factor